MNLKCPDCNNDTVIQVAEQSGQKFYSCYSEDCNNYAQMLLDVGDEGDHQFIRFDDMFNGGGDEIKNLITLCAICHEGVHKGNIKIMRHLPK